ncbi:glycosyltransferase family 4 protein [Mesorhizobium sp. WSM4303]|uniref:glycosyltransferase family 4 protein n=1 Tax=unclassified Mesorhizobium TaxID=325217 RepID=UPI00115D953E|nr:MULTISPECIES: glycosyltransferase family 4 protein [unclassified Mesorhizobium]TRC98336.1 glycosyltransferase family 4 protein [Mesorhizobium sp. WSM4306]TRD04314.1 glycosyltransferase family 4 protein [Mesorhizobium sp. WSM4303]
MTRSPRVLPGGQTDERTHVLEVLGNAIVGGMENYVRNLAANLPSNEFKVSLLCPFESPYTALLRSEGRDVYIAPLRDDPPWKTVELICTLVRETGVGLLHAHLMNAHTVAAIAGRLSGTPTVATLHGMSLHAQEISVARTTGSHTIVVCREAWSQALAVGLAPELVSLVPNGVDLAKFHPKSADPAEFRQTINVGPADIVVGFVGRLAWEKGPDKFIKAAEFILQRRPEVHFAMVGTGLMEKDLGATVRRAGLESRIHMIGLAREPHRIYPALDLLLHTSRADAMPLTILEAMASGVPVVAIGVGGVPEIVATGETGVLVGTTEWPGIVSEYPGDWEGVALAAISLLSNPARLKSMSGASVRRAQACFDIQQSATLTSHIFRQLLGARTDKARLHSVP